MKLILKYVYNIDIDIECDKIVDGKGEHTLNMNRTNFFCLIAQDLFYVCLCACFVVHWCVLSTIREQQRKKMVIFKETNRKEL